MDRSSTTLLCFVLSQEEEAYLKQTARVAAKDRADYELARKVATYKRKVRQASSGAGSHAFAVPKVLFCLFCCTSLNRGAGD